MNKFKSAVSGFAKAFAVIGFSVAGIACSGIEPAEYVSGDFSRGTDNPNNSIECTDIANIFILFKDGKRLALTKKGLPDLLGFTQNRFFDKDGKLELYGSTTIYFGWNIYGEREGSHRLAKVLREHGVTIEGYHRDIWSGYICIDNKSLGDYFRRYTQKEIWSYWWE